MGIVFLPPQWPNQLWEHFLLLLHPLLFSPCSDLNRGVTGEKRHMPSRPIRTHTKRKIKLLRHARMRTRRYERILAHTSSNTERDNNERVWKGGKEWIAWSCKERAQFKSLRMTNGGGMQSDSILHWFLRSQTQAQVITEVSQYDCKASPQYQHVLPASSNVPVLRFWPTLVLEKLTQSGKVQLTSSVTWLLIHSQQHVSPWRQRPGGWFF